MENKDLTVKVSMIYRLYISTMILLPCLPIGAATIYFEIPEISFLMLIPVSLSMISIIQNSVLKYVITAEEIQYFRGILNYKKDRIEFYRIKDYIQTQTLFFRIFGLMTVVIVSVDKTMPSLVLRGIVKSSLVDTIRERVEILRTSKRGYFEE